MPNPSNAMPPFEVKAELLRRNWIAPVVAALFAIVVVIVGGAFHVALLAWPLALSAVVFAIGSLTHNAFPRARRIVLRASSVEIVLGDATPITIDQIAEAKLEELGEERATMRIVLRDGTERWLRTAAKEATPVLRALSFSVGPRRATFRVMLSVKRRFLASLVAVGAAWLVSSLLRGVRPDAGIVVVGIVFFLLPVAALLTWLTGFWPGKLVVAADGMTLKWLRHERYIPFTDVVAVRAIHRFASRVVDTRIELRSGSSLNLHVRDTPVTEAQVGGLARALHTQVVEAFESAKRRAADVQNVAALLCNDGRSGAEWLAHLDGVMGGVARYRVAAPAPEVLSTIASDPKSTTDARAAAAALLARIDDSGRLAVRVAADACAEPVLRAALVAISDAESDEAFAAALDRARKR